jgi:putative ABC transport system substrate-binding protein
MGAPVSIQPVVKAAEVIMTLKSLSVALSLFIVALASSLPAGAQGTAKVWRIGLMHVGLDHVPPSLAPLGEGLRALGYEAGRNIRLDFRNLADEAAAHAVAREFVRDRVDLIVAFEEQALRGARAATSEIPVVFLHLADPVADGFVESLARPGGNVTGFITYPVSPSKQIELFSEVVPRPRRLLVLVDPKDTVTRRALPEVRNAGDALRIQVMEREVTTASDLERVLGAADRREVDGVFALSQTLWTNFPSLILRRATERRLAVVTHRKEWVRQGALLSYAADLATVGRSAAPYIDKILKGTRPAELPVMAPTKFELVINLKVAGALGLTIPPSLLLRADHLIR